jgi:hypothetical protein
MSTLPSNENHDSTERYYAEMEGARAYAEEEYFNARPQLLATHIERGLFRAGFERAYSALWSKRPRNETPEQRYVEIGELVLIDELDGNNHPLIFAQWNPKRYQLPAGTKIYAPAQKPGGGKETGARVPFVKRSPAPEDCLCWRDGDGLVSQTPDCPIHAQKAVLGECQHDLLKPDTTIEVIDPWKAKCKVCIEFFDLPGRPSQGKLSGASFPENKNG